MRPWWKALVVIAHIGMVIGCISDRSAPAQSLPKQKNSIGITMIRLPGGQFKMGHNEHRKPVHVVDVSPFWISATEVTNSQYEKAIKGHVRSKSSPGNDDPVTNVGKEEAADFAKKLSQIEGKDYRLPSDAQWEFAARGGLDQKDFPWGDSPDGSRANFSGTRSPERILPVASFPPNAFGLYDMSGNAAEWVLDTTLDFPSGVERTVQKDPVHLDTSGRWLTRGGSAFSWYPFVWFADPLVKMGDKSLYWDCGIRLVMVEKAKK